MKQHIRSICILRLSALGDVCHAVASVQAIQKHYPEAEITWVLGKVEAMLIGDLPGIRFVIFDKKKGLKGYRELKQQLPQTFDVLLHMQLSFRANIAAWVIKAKRKIGFSKKLSKELHGLVVNEHVEHQSRPHVYDGFKAFAQHIGIDDFEPAWNIPIDNEDRLWAEQMCAAKPVLVIAASASKAERNWLPERYAAIADYATEKGFTVIITGASNDKEMSLARDIVGFAQKPLLNLVGKTNLKQLLALIGAAKLVLAPDTGAAHMAVTQNTPVLGLYAHSNPLRTGPYTYLDYVVEVYHQQFKQLHGISVEQARWGKRLKGATLMSLIEVQQVKDKFDQIITLEQLVPVDNPVDQTLA